MGLDDPDMLPEERKSADNGIWLCKDCAYIIDHEPENFNVETLLTWKRTAEQKATRDSALKEDGVRIIIEDLDTAIEKINLFLDGVVSLNH